MPFNQSKTKMFRHCKKDRRQVLRGVRKGKVDKTKQLERTAYDARKFQKTVPILLFMYCVLFKIVSIVPIVIGIKSPL